MDRNLYDYVSRKFNKIEKRLGGPYTEGGMELDDIVTDLAEEFEAALSLAVEARNAVDRRYASHDSIGEPV